jgi:uncharacterized membrane protein
MGWWAFCLPTAAIPTPAVAIWAGCLLDAIAVKVQGKNFLTSIAAQSFSQNYLLQMPTAAGTGIGFAQVNFLLFVDGHRSE